MSCRHTVQVVFQTLEVGQTANNAGIFVGHNTAHLWSSHNKQNSGFGTSEGEIQHCTNVVFDNDYIDSPVDDRDTLLIHEPPSEAQQQSIGFKSINVQHLEANSSLSVGSNAQQGWAAHSKTNNGQGTAGVHLSHRNLNMIQDNDTIDTPIRSVGVQSSAVNR